MWVDGQTKTHVHMDGWMEIFIYPRLFYQTETQYFNLLYLKAVHNIYIDIYTYIHTYIHTHKQTNKQTNKQQTNFYYSKK